MKYDSPLTPVPDWRIETATLVGPKDHPLRGPIADIVDAMPDKYRRPIEMWAWEGLTYEAIAKELGLAGRSSGQDRVRQALRELERELRARGLAPDETTDREPDSERDSERQLRGVEGGVRIHNRPARGTRPHQRQAHDGAYR